MRFIEFYYKHPQIGDVLVILIGFTLFGIPAASIVFLFWIMSHFGCI